MRERTRQLPEQVRYQFLKYLAERPEATQRDVARELGISLGKVNYCLRALMSKGWVKVRNFRTSRNKAAYAYILTPGGLEEKVNVTLSFLRRKIDEYDQLADEIEELKREVVEFAATTARPPKR